MLLGGILGLVMRLLWIVDLGGGMGGGRSEGGNENDLTLDTWAGCGVGEAC